MKTLILLAFILFAVPVSAQVPVSGWSTIYWDQDGYDHNAVATYTYRLVIDHGPRVILSGVACTPSPAAGAFVCSAKLPAMTPGPHVVQLTAGFVPNVEQSEPSEELAITFLVVVTPRNLRLTP